MNREAILELADTIEQHYHARKGLFGCIGFNLAGWYGDIGVNDHVDSCGTTACIAGWAVAIAEHRKHWTTRGTLRALDAIESARVWGVFNEATALLGLDLNQANGLFTLGDAYEAVEPMLDPQFDCSGSLYELVTPPMAVAALRHLAETGKVDWLRAIRSVLGPGDNADGSYTPTQPDEVTA